MAVYFDHRLDSAGPSDINRDFAWSQGTTALLAVASESNGGGGTVNIFNEEVCTFSFCFHPHSIPHLFHPIHTFRWVFLVVFLVCS